MCLFLIENIYIYIKSQISAIIYTIIPFLKTKLKKRNYLDVHKYNKIIFYKTHMTMIKYIYAICILFSIFFAESYDRSDTAWATTGFIVSIGLITAYQKINKSNNQINQHEDLAKELLKKIILNTSFLK